MSHSARFHLRFHRTLTVWSCVQNSFENLIQLCTITLKSLIEEQTGINEQAWKESATLLAYH